MGFPLFKGQNTQTHTYMYYVKMWFSSILSLQYLCNAFANLKTVFRIINYSDPERIMRCLESGSYLNLKTLKNLFQIFQETVIET